MPSVKRQTLLAAVATAAPLVTVPADAGAVGPAARTGDAVERVAELADRAHARAARRHVRLHRTNRALEGRRPDADRRREVRDWHAVRLRKANRRLARENRRIRRQTSTAPPHLQAIARCESGGDPGAVSADGTYRGKYQFDRQTWASVGGTGDPAAAPEAEQDRRAAILYARAGATPWPVCG